MRAKYGYLGKMLFVNLSEGKIQEEDLSEDLAKGAIINIYPRFQIAAAMIMSQDIHPGDFLILEFLGADEDPGNSLFKHLRYLVDDLIRQITKSIKGKEVLHRFLIIRPDIR